MTFHLPEVLITIAGLEIRTYGVILASAILVSFAWAERRAAKAHLPKQLAGDIFFWAIIGALIGARLGFVIQDPVYFWQHPAEILGFRLGGLSFHGGLIGALMAGLAVLKKRRALHHFWPLADAAAAPLLLGASIGRLGNWANQELYGYPTSVPWAITIDPAHRLPGYEAFSTFHLTFAYEMILNLVGLMILVFVIEKGKRQKAKGKIAIQTSKVIDGQSFLFAVAWYSLARFITEIWRIGDRLVGPLSLAQLISLGLIIVALAFSLQRKLAPGP